MLTGKGHFLTRSVRWINFARPSPIRRMSGRRKLRTYVKVALLLIAALIVLWGVALYQQMQARKALSTTGTVTVSVSPTPTPEPTPAPEACPTDPDQWDLVDVEPGHNYKRIQPACVYEGLERTVAWVLGIKMGLSRQEVSDALGFERAPMHYRWDGLTILTDLAGPFRVDISNIPANAGYTEWIVTDDGSPGTTMAMWGCFRTFTLDGNQRNDWGDGYPVICTVIQDDLAGYYGSAYGDHVNFQTFDRNYRRHAFFGYTEGGEWVWLGTWRQLYDFTPSQNEYETTTMLFGTAVWDARWLAEKMGVEFRPPPEGWKNMNDPAERQAIVDLINQNPE